jgi:endo-1,4-beta-xylanase
MEGNPVISILPSQFASDKIIQLKDGRIGAQDTNGKLVARTRYSFAQNGWEWATDKESLQDFTIREYADAMDIPFSVFTDKSLFGNPEYDLSIETTANEIVIAAELDPNRVFGDFSIDDLNKILSNWNSITSSLNQGIIPEGFNYNWKDADIVVRYAKEHNMNLSAQHLFWSGESYTFPDSLTKGNFNNEELNKLLEFMVKTRVIKYKGIIDEWEGAAEVAGQLSYAQPSFLIGKLGMGIIDKVFTWAHEANPDAKLRYTEDQVLETDNPSLINGFWQLLRHFKDANVPVDAITAENNMWIYTPPDKQHMIDVLKQIKNMGYEIGTPETTVVTSNIFPIWPTRKRTVDTVTDIFKAQAKIYENIADSYLQAGTKVFGLGGFTDADEWYKVLASYDTNAMIFDKNYQPKPSYFALLNVLKKYI